MSGEVEHKTEEPRELQGEDLPIINFVQVANHAAMSAPGKLRFEGIAKVYQWMQDIHDDDAMPVFVSWYELLADFQIRTNLWGLKSTSTHGTWSIFSCNDVYDCQKACRLTACFLTSLIRLGVPNFKPAHGRPFNYRFQCWTMGVRMRLAASAKANIDNWLKDLMGDRHIDSIAKTFAVSRPATLEVDRVQRVPGRFGLRQFFA